MIARPTLSPHLSLRSLLAVSALAVLLSCDHQVAPTTQQPEILSEPVPMQIVALEKEHAFDVDGPARPSILYADPNAPVPSLSDTSYDIYGVTFLWGNLLPLPIPNPVPVDWSGNLVYNGVAVLAPLVPINFEHQQDTLFPSTIPNRSAWGSKTIGNDIDGLAFILFVKRGVTYAVEPLLTFATPPFTHAFHQAELEKYSAFFPIPGKGGVAVFSHRLIPVDCPRGALKGDWIKDSLSGQTGRVQGVFASESGEPSAMFGGTFQMIPQNTGAPGGTMQGLITAYMRSTVLGIFHGTWRYTDPRMCPICGSGKGEFMAEYKLTDGTSGRMLGTFGYPPNDQQLSLPLVGVWRTECAHGEDPALSR